MKSSVFLWISAALLPFRAMLAAGAESIQDIGNTIYTASGVLRSEPQIIVAPPSALGVAWYDSTRNAISIKSDVIDFINQQYDRRATDALALLLAHEYGHFYWQHGWAEHFGLKTMPGLPVGAQALVVSTAQELAFNEGQADSSAITFDYLAGYDVQDIVEELYTKLYKKYDIPPDSRYPSLADRIGILRKSLDEARNNILPFDAGVLLLLTDEFESAGSCFSYVAKTFPGREVLNNSGVGFMLATLGRIPTEAALESPALAFSLPITLDNELQLKSAEDKRNIFQKAMDLITPGEKSLVRAPPPRPKFDFSKAKAMFRKAEESDPKYAPAKINLACISAVEHEWERAIGYAKEAVALLEHKQGEEVLYANALLALGISYSISELADGKALAAGCFMKAQMLDQNHQFDLIQASNKPALSYAPPLPRIPNEKIVAKMRVLPTVDIESQTPTGLPEAPSYHLSIPAAQSGQPDLELAEYLAANHNGAMGEVIVIDQGAKRMMFACSGPDFNGQIAPGLKVGSTIDEVRSILGNPLKIFHSRTSTFCIFRKNRLILELDKEGRIVNWISFSIFNGITR